MIVYSSKPEEQFYSIISEKGPSVTILGEMNEHWTSISVNYLTEQGVPVFFYPWSKIQDIRLQFEVVKYPIVQLWLGGELKAEVIGYQEEPLESLSRQFFRLKHNRS